MKLHIPVCIPLVTDPRTVARIAGWLVRLPRVDEVSMPVFRRRHLRRSRGDTA